MNINTLDLNLLRVFHALECERHVSRAAISIGITQSAMSNALIRLRRHFNDELFTRSQSGMMPTALAERLASPIGEALFVLSNAFESPFEFVPESSTRVFRLLMSDAGEAAILPSLISAVRKVAPQVRIESAQIPHDQYVQALESGAADLAIGNLPFLDTGFHQRRLFDDEYCCISSGDAAPELTVEEYLEREHVRVNTGNGDLLIDNELTKIRARRRIALAVQHYHTAVEVVSKTGLVAIVPSSCLPETSRIKIHRPPFDLKKARVRQFWHKKVNHEPGNQWLRQTIAKGVQVISS